MCHLLYLGIFFRKHSLYTLIVVQTHLKTQQIINLRLHNKGLFMTKHSIYSIRLTEDQRAKLNRKATEMGMKTSELLRTQIFKLLDYGSYGLKDKK